MANAKHSESDARYAIEAQAGNLFAFLRETFSKMPRPVQVIGWMVFLLLFVFLVLYPMIGITYFHGKVVTLKRTPDGQRVMAMAQGLRVHKGTTTSTNEEGEFTVAVRIPSVPFLGTEFDFGDGERKEIVPLPGPMPFVSMFNPNTRKIFYVPGSNVQDRFGVSKRFFLDAEEARRAFVATAGGTEGKHGLREGTAGPVVFERFRNAGIAHAAEHNYREPTYTLRLRELKLTQVSSRTSEIYFEILVDGKPLRVREIPHADSKPAERLTVFSDIPLRPQELDIPLSTLSRRIEIAVLTGGLLRDSAVGSVAMQLNSEHVGRTVKLAGKDMELTVEVLPPVAIRYASSSTAKQRYTAIMWLDTPARFAGQVLKVRYEYADKSSIGFPEVSKVDQFATAVSRWQPERVTAQVWFASGSAIKLAAYLEPGRREPRTALDYYFMARLSAYDREHQLALDQLEKALQGRPDFAPAITFKASTLANMGKYSEAIAWYERALAADPGNPLTLNSYAWTIADLLPQPTHAQLLAARLRAEQAVRMIPDPNHYDTLGWVSFKLGDYPQALRALTEARAGQARLAPSSSTWVDIHFHLGQVYLKLGRIRDSKDAFREVLKYGETYGVLTKNMETYVGEARTQLTKLGS